ncbi:unknown protein [Simkania negevensis Z]|uniref:Uncharacterized protein n=1 Tax=Simkania negevensis (strain ATCC VR-1471 / DSM 27360 / Z) TaxID=331113 RepID=F8L3Q2_SIMNZ|nr:unknown protein [Simkania negevensis Z]
MRSVRIFTKLKTTFKKPSLPLLVAGFSPATFFIILLACVAIGLC